MTERRATLIRLGALPVLLGAAVLIGCGISVDAGDPETEVFRDLELDGEFVTGGLLNLSLYHAQIYTVPVNINCEVIAVDDSLVPTPIATATETPTLAPGVTPTSLPLPAPRETPENRVMDFMVDSLQPNEEGGPVGEATPVLGSVEFEFRAPDLPGDYVLRCYTPQDDNNSISEPFTIEAAPTLVP
jgi:hypothetical protein